MMVVTHVAVGLALAVPVAVVAPSYATAAVLGGFVGGAVPDLDLLVGEHRRTLHFPVLGVPAAAAGVAVATLAPGPATVGLATALVAAAAHSASDVLGAGEELRPWERTNTNAVYDHLRGRWLRARYVVRYDGSPEDLLLTAVFAVPVAVVYDGGLRWVVVALVAVAALYTAVRKRLVPYFARIVG